MAREVRKLNKQTIYFRKKRNSLLFFLLLLFISLFASFVILSYTEAVSLDLLLTIYLPITIIYLFFLFAKKNKLDNYVMKYQYFKMIDEEIGVMPTSKKLYTTSWMESFIKEGFTKVADEKKFVVLYKVSQKLEYIKSSKGTLEIIVIAKQSQFDFYSEEIDQVVRRLFQSKEEMKSVQSQIVYQFKKYDILNDENIEESRKIINYKYQHQYLIHLTSAYSEKNQEVYFLCPIKTHPSKYYYYACKKMKSLCNIKEDDHE